MLKKRISGLYSHLENRTLSVYWQTRAVHVLHHLDINHRDIVLEIGCGGGLWTSYIAPKAHKMVAVDMSIDRMQAARLWTSPSEPVFPTGAVRFVQAKGEYLPFPDQTFNKLVCIDVIEHIPNDNLAIKEFSRLLTVGGKAVITTLLENRPSYIKKTVFLDHVREYTVENFTSLFNGTELEIEQIFNFYYAPSTIAREVQGIAYEAKMLRLPLFASAGALGRVVSGLEHHWQLGHPGGIGVVAKKLNNK